MTTTAFHLHAGTTRAAPRPPGASPSRDWRPLRLTRRGRFVVLLAAVVMVLALVAAISGPADSAGSAHHAAGQTVVVEPGQTLWEIAQAAAPGEDTRVVVAEIVELNSLPDGGALRAGQPLYLPEY